ncbi:MAG: hypothetical protein GXO79_10285 [Chlorobi bacterium]|nr:hypothetical protein [Chlorobiota bacterium]
MTDNIENQNLGTEKTGRESNAVNPIFYIILAVLFLLLSVIAIMYFKQRKETDRIIAQMAQTTREKENLSVELDNLLHEYDGLKTDNDSLNSQMLIEQDKIKQMLVEVRRVKATNVSLIAKYKKELGTLRQIMRGYIVQIDSLNTLNIKLMDENVAVKNKYTAVQKNYNELSQKTEDLSSKVEIASVIKTDNLEAIATNKKSKPVSKAKKVDKIKVCMTLDENPIAKPGLKDVFVRIISPEDLVLASSADDLFTFNNEKIVFSAKRQVEYLNVDIDLCIYWKNNQELTSGKYLVDVYTDGKLIGSTSLELK